MYISSHVYSTRSSIHVHSTISSIHLVLSFKSYWALSLTLRYLSLCSQGVAFLLLPVVVLWMHAHRVARSGQPVGVSDEKVTTSTIAFWS
ncbi:hypothetical protein Taro_050968 [Colocasia esculenta]|uniref:Uncharacterized protein n=1 Tax=Colocasia esculenta TaxID=4460 RepID=A0A843XFJ4_COLES|nr:hypothetical protein [Colocasia esculenta]